MLARVHSAVLTGIEAHAVDVEVHLGNGLPAFNIVGLPDTSVQEARDRVRAALNHAGLEFPLRRITVNLAPSDIPKHGAALDLPIALGLVACTNERLPRAELDSTAFVGELGLNGEVRPVRGALACGEAVRARGLARVACPAPNAGEAALASVPTVGVRTLQEAVEVLEGAGPATQTADAAAHLAGAAANNALDLAVIRGQQHAKRAVTIAAAGRHNLLLTGPPGAGKTLLARALAGVLPPLTVDEALEVTRIHSAAGLLAPGHPIVAARPFRAPHHGISLAGLVGGGAAYAKPGEVSLAHRGVLFMDEFPEFPRSCLEALRQPVEDGVVTIVRLRHAVTYPARFMLVAAMNPCPCGDPAGTGCVCRPVAADAYRQRISGPLLDRVDLRVDVPRVEAGALLTAPEGEGSGDVRLRVAEAQRAAAERARFYGGAPSNAELGPIHVLRAARLDARAARTLETAAERHRLSGRGIHRVLRVARTIADLDGRDCATSADVLEAVGYRVADRRPAARDAS